jgi:HEAT repeat protein/beta-lactamase regulating signal transducer with metallopeptidase domain
MIATTWSDLVVASVLKGAAVLLLAYGATRLLRRRPAAVRHGVWLAAIVAQLLIPVLGAALPAWRVELPAWAVPALAAAGAASGQPRERAPWASALPVPSAPDRAPGVDDAPAPVAAAPSGVSDGPSNAPAVEPTAATGRWSAGQVVLAVWALGAAVILLRLVAGIGAVAVLARRARRVKDAEWLVLATELSEAMGLARPVVLLRGGPLSVPVTWGILVPAVLLPPDADQWPEERRRAVLLHELAHVRRHDAFAQLLAYLVLATCWFNPLVWLAVRAMRAESERACDDCVLRHGTEPSAYVQDLLAIVRAARERRTPPALAALAMARPTEFEGRVLAILDGSAPRHGAGRVAKLLTAAAVLALVAPLAAMRPVGAAPVAPRALPGAEPAAPSLLASDAETARAALGLPRAPRAAEASLRTATPRLQLPGVTPTPTPMPTPTPTPMPDGRRFDVDVDDAVRDAMRDAARNLRVNVEPKVSVDMSRGWANPKVKVDVGRVRTGSGGGESAAVPGLAAALSDSDMEVRRSAARALGSLEDPRAVDALTQALRRDADEQVRATAAWALGQIDDRRAVSALTEAVREDRAVGVRKQAAWALGQIEDPAAVPALGAALRDADADVRRQAVWALGQIEDARAVPPLVEALGNADVATRRQAAWALGQIDSREATAALGNALRDRDTDVRKQAAWALGQIEDPAAVNALAAALRDGAAEVRKQAAWALGQIEAPSAVPGLSAALRDESREVRKMAAWALAQIEDPAAVPGLVEMTRSDDVELRRSAAYALSQIRGVAATEALLALLKDADPTVRRHAARALGGR